MGTGEVLALSIRLLGRVGIGLMLKWGPAGLAAVLTFSSVNAELVAAQPAEVFPKQQKGSTERALGINISQSTQSLDIVIIGTGSQPELRQTKNGSNWSAVLKTSVARGVIIGSKRFSVPEAGIESITLDGGGNRFNIKVSPLSGMPLGRPVVSANGEDLILTFPLPEQVLSQTVRPSIKEPGVIPSPQLVPELRPRAVAPPLGDMAVGSMVLRNQSYLNVSGPPVTLTLKNAPAKDALMSLARIGGYGFVFVDDQPSSSTSRPGARNNSTKTEERLITLSFRNESYAKSLNSILLASGLQGKKEGSLIFAGSNVLSKSFGPQISKVYRLNQASAASAADYLASLGASISKVNVVTATSSTSDTAGTASSSASSTSALTEKISSIETYGAAAGPLKGLSGTTDSRLQTITLVGEAKVIAVAENYLRQLDLRQRQVALNVQILDVGLSNDFIAENSFAFRYGNNLIVSNRGELIGSWNGYGVPGEGNGNTDLAPGAYQNYPKNVFYDYLKTRIESGSTKLLASPTLILSENPEVISGGQEVATGASEALNTASIGRPRANEAFVTVGTEVVTSFQVQAGQNGAPNTCQPEFGTAGLTFGARISKIDDNGFVTFAMSPSVSAATDSQLIPSCGPVSILSVRRLDTGTLRVRDGQTLVLTGVISESIQQDVRKWPILGDIPLIGQFFRESTNTRDKRELVILVTPRIINDNQGGSYGYGYRPVTEEAKSVLSSN